MRRSDCIALILSLCAILASYLVSDLVFEAMPHIEDEMAYVWQAQVIAKGKLTLPSPPNPKAFLVPFVVDYHGQRFGKYPPGWPVVLALGMLIKARPLVNPLLAGAGVWLTYRLGKRLFSEVVGLLAAGLTLTSPFFLMNSGSLLSHPFGLFLSVAFALAWLDAWRPASLPELDRASSMRLEPESSITHRVRSAALPEERHACFEPVRGNVAWLHRQPQVGGIAHRRHDVAWLHRQPQVGGIAHRRHDVAWLHLVTAALCLGLLVLTRPLTAVGICLPFCFHGVYLFLRGNRQTRLRLVVFILIVLVLSSLLLIWQYAVTGDARLNPYTLWWSYDKVGFGPGYGHTKTGHTWQLARINTRFSLFVGRHDLFGWGSYSWIFLPFGLAALFYRRVWKALPAMAVFACLVFVYLFYWIGSSLFGPRYYFEGLYSLTILSAAGMAFLAGWPIQDGAESAPGGKLPYWRHASRMAHRRHEVAWLSRWRQTVAWLHRQPQVGGIAHRRHDVAWLRTGILVKLAKLGAGGALIPSNSEAKLPNLQPGHGWQKIRPLLMTAFIALLLSVNLLFYLPIRLHTMYGLYGINRSRLLPFQTPQAQQVTPALVVVHPDKWTEYGALLELETPFLDTPFIFVIDVGEKTVAALEAEFPARNLIHYYPAEPYVFYRVKR